DVHEPRAERRRPRARRRRRAHVARSVVAAAAAPPGVPRRGPHAGPAPRGDHAHGDDRRVPARDERDVDAQERARRAGARPGRRMRLRIAGPGHPMLSPMARTSDERGGTLLRLLAALFVLFLLATGGLLVYTRTQDPLRVSEDATIGVE